jgi:hypothetical protein
MKTVKLVMIASLLTFTAVNVTKADHPIDLRVINISFEEAIQNPGLVVAMHMQLNSNMLDRDQTVYTFNVMYDYTVYRITGTLRQWQIFFDWRFDSRTTYRKDDIR